MRNSENLNTSYLFWEKLWESLHAEVWSSVMKTEISCFQETFIHLKPPVFLTIWKWTNRFSLQLLSTRTGSWTEFCSLTFEIIVWKSKLLAILLEQNWIDCLFKFTLLYPTVIGCYFFKRMGLWKHSPGISSLGEEKYDVWDGFM